ncbi:MAG: anthranilate synthase component I family protein [Prevotellaceae bacterium]|jgi:anthranilate synthase component 1|nr:anthranilate synthase component I family protein [Prevotellaceae bacterium]
MKKDNNLGEKSPSGDLGVRGLSVRSVSLLADLQTPISMYLKIRELYPESVLLESSDFHSNENSYSFIGIDPVARFQVEKATITTMVRGEAKVEKSIGKDVSVPDELNAFIHSFVIRSNENPSGVNGFFGYMSYEAVRYFEAVHPDRPSFVDGTPVPDIMYLLYKYIIVVDHFRNELILVENLFEGETSEMQRVLNVIENRNFASYDFSAVGNEVSNITDEDYKRMVSEGIKRCKRGDVFQIVLSRCFRQRFAGDDFKVYRALRSVNPSPYLFYFDFGSFRIFGSSPETHCKISGGRACIDPIAGTVLRTGDSAKDQRQTEILLADPKENAEHVMLVDLARNDLSRNTSGVKVDFYKEVQYYSHVIHLVSRVSGKVEEGSNSVKVFADTFPAGTLSGAPKVRAMELINSVEKTGRGIYGGCIGYIGLNGDINQAITIRSFFSKNNELYYQAGAGIVSKSKEENELQEVNNKLGALKKAIELAEKLKN